MDYYDFQCKILKWRKKVNLSSSERYNSMYLCMPYKDYMIVVYDKFMIYAIPKKEFFLTEQTFYYPESKGVCGYRWTLEEKKLDDLFSANIPATLLGDMKQVNDSLLNIIKLDDKTGRLVYLDSRLLKIFKGAYNKIYGSGANKPIVLKRKIDDLYEGEKLVGVILPVIPK